MGQHGKYRALVGALCLAASAVQADPCRQALALGLDVSGSVSSAEYRLQLDGLAAALAHPEVTHAILAMPGAPVRLFVYEWSGPRDQSVLLDWTALEDAAGLADVIARLRATRRKPANPATALGTALVFGATQLATQQACWKRTLDISGDGKSNTGPRPQDVSANPALSDITVNALVIGSDAAQGGGPEAGITALHSYFEGLVIRGPGAFTEVALGFDAYEAAMVRKLLRELEGLAISQIASPVQ